MVAGGLVVGGAGGGGAGAEGARGRTATAGGLGAGLGAAAGAVLGGATLGGATLGFTVGGKTPAGIVVAGATVGAGATAPCSPRPVLEDGEEVVPKMAANVPTAINAAAAAVHGARGLRRASRGPMASRSVVTGPNSGIAPLLDAGCDDAGWVAAAASRPPGGSWCGGDDGRGGALAATVEVSSGGAGLVSTGAPEAAWRSRIPAADDTGRRSEEYSYSNTAPGLGSRRSPLHRAPLHRRCWEVSEGSGYQPGGGSPTGGPSGFEG